MIHWPSHDVPMRDTFAAFRELQRAGKVRHIGVCNFTRRLLTEAVESCGVVPLCNQVEYHPFLSQRVILPYMREHGIALVAYSPLARGAVPGGDRRLSHPRTRSRPERCERCWGR